MQYETHIFQTSKGEHAETIPVSCTHLVMVPYEPDKESYWGILPICAYSEREAREIAECHQVTDIWARGANRSFCPPEMMSA